MRRHGTRLLLVFVGTVGAAAFGVRAAEEAKEEKVSIDQVPAAVKAAILSEGDAKQKEGKEEKEGEAGGEDSTEIKGNTQPAKASAEEEGWRAAFPVDKANLVPTGKSPYFILEPGRKSVFKDEEGTKLTITVLAETKVVDGVTTRIVEEREEKNGQPEEISRNYFAMDKTTGDVYYFGEDVDVYKNGKVASHGGAWLSGVEGAKFGLLMPAEAKVGDKFYQEVAPKVAMDRAEIVSVDEELKTPAGTFKCVHVKETSPLEKGASHKWHAAGVGLVKDDEFVLAEKP